MSPLNIFPQYQSFIATIDSERMPSSIKEALKCKNWAQPMSEEMKVLEKNGTWDFVERHGDKKPVGCRWIYTVKHKLGSTLDRYKERPVAKDYTQAYFIDYEETFASVIK